MNFFGIAASLIEFAPTIARLIGGESSEEVAKKVVASAQMLTGKSEVDEIKKIFINKPEIILEFQKHIKLLEYQVYKESLEDRQHARERDIQYVSKGLRNFRSDIMIISAVVGLLGCVVVLTLFKLNLSGEAVGIISTISGIFGSCLKDAYAFEFGSSRGSKEKEVRLAELLFSGSKASGF